LLTHLEVHNAKGEPVRLPQEFYSSGPRGKPATGTGADLFRGLGRLDGDEAPVARLGREGHSAVDQREDRVILAQAHTRARMPLGAALADDDVAGDDGFAAELLDAETAAGGIATVAGRTACFLMGHSK